MAHVVDSGWYQSVDGESGGDWVLAQTIAMSGGGVSLRAQVAEVPACPSYNGVEIPIGSTWRFVFGKPEECGEVLEVTGELVYLNLAMDFGRYQTPLSQFIREWVRVDGPRPTTEAEAHTDGPGVIGISACPVPVTLGSVAHLKLQSGVLDAANDGPGRAMVTLRHDASDADVRALQAWASMHSPELNGSTTWLRIEREPCPLETYLRVEFAKVPDGFTTEQWQARVLQDVETAKRDGARSPTDILHEVQMLEAARDVDGPHGLSTTPAEPRWWKGETAVRPERMGAKRGRTR